ncbi:3-isopropylmalate dehydratase small subunit [Merismopedia glauca]|uniref:3-isopropylmalate dehydratase small subunit n=1 Tax=Merismopedia glauca CCAP 1448/3 TaxID=1296344 RepID=A0A2T1C2X9_9CYAN|nr:3-isopropylmalate dehydratase small subunit [Merismopedia glauca]PSB02497.1 3-isopropylmalate dehydratase small subunit [Merismopedia glauca CCAP 1448/3]
MSQVKKVQQVVGCGVPVVGNDIDTDRIIPARFLRCVTFEGLGEHAFADDRTQSHGQHPFDLPQYQGAKILVVNANFGCGSSREHAPQAIMKWGIEAIIGESFAEIFSGNCIANGVPCVTATSKTVDTLQKILQEQPNTSLSLDLDNLSVTCGQFSGSVTMKAGDRQMLMTGTWDTCGQLVENTPQIQATAAKIPYLQFAD